MWTLERIQALISNRVQEDLHLDYKAAKALGTSPSEKKEVAKDISSFANSDGGVIIYGVCEDSSDRSFPKELDPVDSTLFSAEWIEQVALHHIQPKLSGVKVTSVPVIGAEVIYVVEVPKGETAHQAPDKLYHKRRGRTTEAMWDYEVRDVMGRKTTPKVRIEVSLVRKAREIKDNWPTIPQYTSDPFGRKRVVPEKKYETLEWLRVRAINEGGLVIQYLNVFVELDPPAKAPTGVKGETEPVDEVYCENTIRDIVDFHFTPGIGGGTSTPKYGPSRYDPILPGLTLKLKDTQLVPGSLSPETRITWKAHADNANPTTGEILVSALQLVNG